MSDATGGSSVQRSSSPTAGGAFNLYSETSTLALLRAIHLSSLDVDIKNILRDTVFGFRAALKPVVTPELVQLFADYGFVVDANADPELVPALAVDPKLELVPKAEVQSGADSVTAESGKNPEPEVTETPVVEVKRSNALGFTRITPSFSPVAVTKVASVTTTSVPDPEPKFVPETVTRPESVKEAESTVATTPEVLTETSDSIPEESATPVSEVSASAEQTVSALDSAPDPVSPEPVATTPEPVSASVEPTPVAPATTNAAERIKEIKHEVNEMVGNPVNLIDVHNEVGREYMNALLDAMKKSAGGAGGELETAMKRLEAAFVAVQETMGAHTRPQDQLDPSPVEKHESTVSKEETPQVKPAPEPSPVAPSASTPEFTSVAVTESVPAPEVTPAAPPASSSATPLTSVAKEKQVQEMMVAQKREAATTDKQRKDAEIAAMNPLMTPEVTAGLGQLLSEWSLFKQSGLFGTGPSGIDHPLYKKLAPLPMAAVVAGRFEGVTPQIKRSISDYMNGWRYEEGVMHEQGESFETYLRRVIKHILDKRK